MLRWILGVCVIAAAAAVCWAEDGPVGKRPYEMDWAGRTNDDHPPLVDFESLDGWRVVTKNSAAQFERTREQQLWCAHVGKLTYRGEGTGPAEVRIVPPAPVPIRESFDAVSLWCYGNTWGWVSDPTTPQVRVAVVFLDSAGQEFIVDLWHVDWTEWYVLHKRLTPDLVERVKGGAAFAGIRVTGGRQKDDRVLYFDNLAVFTEKWAPLVFEPRPKRGVAALPYQDMGTNTGPGKLPFPTREQTILPATDGQYTTSAKAARPACSLIYRGTDGMLTYSIRPNNATFGAVTATWQPASGAATTIRPCVDGGAWLRTPTGPALPTRSRLVGSKLAGGVYEERWRVSAGGPETDVTYRYRLWGKSLVIDVLAPGGGVAEVRYGRAVGCANPRMVTHPFYPADVGRPATVVFGPASKPLFLMGNTDWTRTNASTMWATNASDKTGVTYNGGTRYVPLTNGKTVDCCDRLFVTLSPRIEETLPSVPNPASPWKKVTGTRVWRAHGAGDRPSDKKYWADVKRLGMTQVVVTDHETMWRDGGESFTFRTKAAPGKGGDEGARDYSRYMQDVLGFVYGPYNNFTDFAPVNEYWSTDLIARDPANQIQHAWMRCYAPKPARAVEYCAKLSPINQSKYGFSTAYCDVHTAVAPWHRVDHDPRVPGAGTMSAVFYSYGEIMLHQKKAWNGPVYSEGNHHAFYCGLTDGNYGQDQAYRPSENPWLVDFDLRKLHPLACNLGMGSPEMFYANVPQPQGTREERDAWLDRFLAATVAFGHPGFLVMEGGHANAMRSYYMLQQLHSRYCLANAADISYANGVGRLMTSSEAVASGAYRRSQVVTKYTDGTVTAANGSKTDRMKVTAFGRKLDLPPNGYAGWTADGAVEVLSADRGGRRCDYAVTPAYLYVDGRGRFVRFARAAGNGVGVCRVLGKGAHEVILMNGAECGFAVSVAKATALDADGKAMGAAEVRSARGLTYVMPVKGAFSYSLEGAGAPSTVLACARTDVVPGERVTVRGRASHVLTIPVDAKPGSRIWRKVEGHWIDFTVTALADVTLTLDGDDLRVGLVSGLPANAVLNVKALGATVRVALRPGQAGSVGIPIGPATEENAETLTVETAVGSAVQVTEAGLRTVRATRPIAAMPARWVGGICERGKPEQQGYGTTGAHVLPARGESGGIGKDAWNMHPPWIQAVGYVYALFDPLELPAGQPSAFRALVGKLDGSDPGDGILYKVVVVDASGAATVAGEHTVREHRWEPIEADLSRWAGRKVRLKLIADPGPADDSSGDWASWTEMRIETLSPVLHRTLDGEADRYRRGAGPYPIESLTVADLRSAVRGWLRYDGKGLNSGAYGSFGLLNGLELGELPEAGGNETLGLWAERVGVPLPKEAITTLGPYNRFILQNPKHDWFSIRRVWVELELADGRKCSSDIALAAFTQPAEWPYAEGIRVPFGTDIEVGVWFRMR